MKTCNEIDSVMTPYVDGEALLAVGEEVEDHLEAAFAAQLAIDHEKCFAEFGTGHPPLDATVARNHLATVHGVDVPVPVGDDQEQVDARSCEYDGGRMAHLLYEMEGRHVSLFVVPEGAHAERSIEVVGHQARLWSTVDVGYVLVGDVVGAEDAAVMDKVAAYMRAYGDDALASTDERNEHTMTLRWMVAGVAAFGLALLTLPAELTHTHAHTAETAGSAAAMMESGCDVDARPADFDFTLQDMNGEEVSFSELKGKVVLLNFWATWCGPCKIEMPWFVEFADEYEDQGLVVLGVSIDDTADKIKEFAETYDVDYPMLIGLEREDFMESYGPIWGVPMTFFIDRDGALCRTHAGIAAREEFEKDITDLL